MAVRKTILWVLVFCLLATASCSASGNKKSESSTTQASSSSSNDLDSFYVPPKILASDAPGSIIRYEKVEVDSKNIDAWRILYVTTSVREKSVAASAFILAPKYGGTNKLVAWAHGTVGIADKCALSRRDKLTSIVPFLSAFIKSGYAVVAPDYEGLGTPGIHPYLIGSSEGRSVLDSIRMAKNFDKIKVSGDSVVVGHSQGGHAALFAGQLRSVYAPDVSLAGIVALAPAGNLGYFFKDDLSSISEIGPIALGAVSFADTYPELDLKSIMSSDAIKASSVVDKECLDGVKKAFNKLSSDPLTRNPNELSDWKARLDENSPGNAAIDTPVLIEHGLSDKTVPSNVSEEIFKSLCEKGSKVERKTYSGALANHVGVVVLGQFDTINFVKSRFAGETFENGCSKN